MCSIGCEYIYYLYLMGVYRSVLPEHCMCAKQVVTVAVAVPATCSQLVERSLDMVKVQFAYCTWMDIFMYFHRIKLNFVCMVLGMAHV